jgi:hypothetical protein
MSETDKVDPVNLLPRERLIMICLLVFAFSVGVVLLLLNVFWLFVPAIGVLIVFGTGLAILSYFLGNPDNKLSIRGAKLTGAMAVTFALVYLFGDALDTQLGGLQRIRELERMIAEMTERANGETVLGQHVPRPITGDGRVTLEEINTLNGWQEGDLVADGDSFRLGNGDHAENVDRAEIDQILVHVLGALDIRTPSAAEVRGMSQARWDAFLRSLPANKQIRIGRIPFARLRIQSSDGHVEHATVFSGQQIPVLNNKGRAEAYLCIKRVLDVRERTSNESEVVVLAHSRRPCQ